jgi:hypothetical protein
MRPSLVEVLGRGLEYAVELLLMQDEQLIETLTAHTSQKPFTDGIRARGFLRCCEHLDVTRLRHTGEDHPKLAIVLTDEVLRSCAKSGGFPQRYVRPTYRWETASRPHGSLFASSVR